MTSNQTPNTALASVVRTLLSKHSASQLSNSHIGMGRANEQIARTQESYISNATSSWLESLERSLAQMKEYQVRYPYPIILLPRLYNLGRSQEAGNSSISL